MPRRSRRPSTHPSTSQDVSATKAPAMESSQVAGRERLAMASTGNAEQGEDPIGLGVWGAAAAEQAHGGAGDAETNTETNTETEGVAPSLSEVGAGAVIELGMSGPSVSWVQGALHRLGYPVAQTGELGDMTAGLVRQFQQSNKVEANGRVGPTTLARMQAAVEASVSLDELAKLAPGVDRSTLAEYLPHLNAAMLEHGITSDTRKAAFLAQLGHESDGFNTLEEYASGADYEGRTDLGNIFPGDGQHFKGRGPIQITGRYNYKQYGEKLGVDLIANPELAATPELGFQIAGQYWADHGLNELADEGQFDSITQRINGGQNGQADRRQRWGQAKSVLAENAQTPKVSTPTVAASTQSGETTPAGPAPEEQGSTGGASELAEICRRLGGNDATGAKSAAARFAAARRTALGVAQDSLTKAAGRVWTAADHIVRAAAALKGGQGKATQDAAHRAAEMLRGLRDDGVLPSDAVEPGIARAGRMWTQADGLAQQATATNGQAHDGNAVWTTGRPGGRGGVTSRKLDDEGAWGQNNLLDHHSDRADSWAARNIRNDKNQDLQAYDFTFEKRNERGEAIAGSAQGLELISPWDAKVHDVNHSFAQSGGYGKFIALEDVETGLRFEVHHLDTVADVGRGADLAGGDFIGTQGGSGTGRHDYATHVDIVGTAEAVEQFVRANQSGRFRSKKNKDGA